MTNGLKLLPKIIYYWILCLFLSPHGRGLNPYEGSSLKHRLTILVPGNKNAAVRLVIWGEVTGVGFGGWLYRKARTNGLVGLAFPRGKNTLEAVLVGSASSIETMIKAVWKGPTRAKVTKVREDWFNKPINAEEKRKIQVGSKNKSPWSPETAYWLRKTLDYLGPLMETPNRFEETAIFTSAGEIERAALDRNLCVLRMGKMNYIISPKQKLGLQNSQSSRVSSIVRSVTNHKHLTKILLRQHGLPVPRGGVFKEIQEAQNYLRSCKYPLVVKPLAGTYGRGITVDVRTEEALAIAWKNARSYHKQVVIEEFVTGVDLRVLVAGGKAGAALLRVPANVVGDGKKTIEKLIDHKNQERLANPRLCKAPIIPDVYTAEFLKRQGYSLKSIPKNEEVVFLHLKANISAGGDSIGLTDHIHPDLMRLAEEAALVFGGNAFWGIDLLVERIDLPRNQQQCCVIEVNSKANIFNVQFPLYGKPIDVAKMYIDHLYPEDTAEEAYPLQRIKVKVTGVLDRTFSDYFRRSAQNLKLNCSIQQTASTAEMIISGRQHHILSVLDQLWDGQNINGSIIDGLQVREDTGSSKGTIFIDAEGIIENKKRQQEPKNGERDTGHIPVTIYTSPEQYGERGYDLNTQLFMEEFERRGYQVKPLYDELLIINKDGRSRITGMRYSSTFCDEACAKIYPAQKLLALHGLPVARGAMFKCGRKRKKAVDYFTHIAKPCVATVISAQGVTHYEVNNLKEFNRIWEKARLNGNNNIFIEERVEGWQVMIAVVAGQAVGSLVVEPVSICGDGELTIRQLIEDKNRQRLENPWYKEGLVTIDKHLTMRLKLHGYRLDTVPAKGVRICLGTETGLEWSGETVNIDQSLHSGFKNKAIQATNVITGLEFAIIHMIIPYPAQPPGEQRWVIKRIDTKPNAAMFHFPWRGKPCNVVGKVISDLCLTRRAMGIKIDQKGELLCRI